MYPCPAERGEKAANQVDRPGIEPGVAVAEIFYIRAAYRRGWSFAAAVASIRRKLYSGGKVSTEGSIKMLEELVRIRTEKLKVLKVEFEGKGKAMASVLESLEADKKELEQLKKENQPRGE